MLNLLKKAELLNRETLCLTLSERSHTKSEAIRDELEFCFLEKIMVY